MVRSFSGGRWPRTQLRFAWVRTTQWKRTEDDRVNLRKEAKCPGADSNHSFQPSFSSKTGRRFHLVSGDLLERRIPGKNGEGRLRNLAKGPKKPRQANPQPQGYHRCPFGNMEWVSLVNGLHENSANPAEPIYWNLCHDSYPWKPKTNSQWKSG